MILIEGCPRKLVANEIHDLLLAADLAEKHIWPVAGGWLNQTQSAVAGIRLVWHYQAIVEKALSE